MSLQIEKFIEEFKKSPDIMKEKVIDFFQYLKYIAGDSKLSF
ncbi:MAG: hypothetical protein PWR06_1500 [Thermoanaerobacteraceae bacterium]|nr:hypothetical protein [Thermoanaerobacteraceae bacterium]MDN5311229.1 hypothetical protein [Thermoanaerobacteraceae bacterium]